jgi:hypothetical protein
MSNVILKWISVFLILVYIYKLFYFCRLSKDMFGPIFELRRGNNSLTLTDNKI